MANMTVRRLGAALVVIVSAGLLAAGCSSDKDSGTGGGLCVNDSREPASCTAQWVLLDPCDVVAQGAYVEAAVFDGACPDDATLSQGDTSAALERQYVIPSLAFQPVDGLAAKSYGFALLVRDDQCRVQVWGCTEADLANIKEIRTAVRAWSEQDQCTPAPAGACPAASTCAGGLCS